MTLIPRRKPKGSAVTRFIRSLPPTRLFAALGGVAAAALAATIARRKATADALEPAGVPPVPTTPDGSAARYTETQKTGA